MCTCTLSEELSTTVQVRACILACLVLQVPMRGFINMPAGGSEPHRAGLCISARPGELVGDPVPAAERCRYVPRRQDANPFCYTKVLLMMDEEFKELRKEHLAGRKDKEADKDKGKDKEGESHAL